jgi:excisionase family DNA binding protein
MNSTQTTVRGAPVVRNLVRVGDVLTVAESAALLKLSKPKVYAMVDAGELSHFRVGSVIRIHREAVESIVCGGGI